MVVGGEAESVGKRPWRPFDPSPSPSSKVTFRLPPAGDYSAAGSSPQPAPSGKAVSADIRGLKNAWFQKGLPASGLTGVRPGRRVLGLQRAKVSGRFAWLDDVWRQKSIVDQYVDLEARFAGSIPRWATTSCGKPFSVLAIATKTRGFCGVCGRIAG